MSKISDSRKILGVNSTTDLQALKAVYRNVMKTYHPDKFLIEQERLEAEETSKRLIEAYHFLVSISPETKAKNEEEYSLTISTAQVVNFHFQKQVLTLDFSNGESFEYFEVSRETYNKFLNSDSPTRFARRRICHEFPFRSVNQVVTV